MKEITYTFIIPHHNCPDLLDRCLNSIPQRDDIQIIVVDDNSDDDKKPIKSNRTEIEYIYIDQNETKGAGRARNVGLKRAKGKWVLFPDADDYYKKGFINIIDKYKESVCDIVYINFEYRDGKTLELLPELFFKKYFDTYDNTQVLNEQIRFHHNVPWTKMIQREFLYVNNIIFEEALNGNDILFSMRVGYKAQNIMVEKTPLYVYLRNKGSILNTKNKSAKYHLCKIKHKIQQSFFFDYIGHPEWKYDISRVLLSHVKEYGIFLFIIIILNWFNIHHSKRVWIKKICR